MGLRNETKPLCLIMPQCTPRVVASFLIILACVSCQRPQPIPASKEAFIGLWRSKSGFEINIEPSGIANVIQIVNPENEDFIKLDIGITPKYAKKMLVGFKGDSVLWVSKPTLKYKAFRIDRKPFLEGDTSKFILNGVVLIKQ
jgi:hypothetical protein